ncbi:uncharacterized protein METZ01_LOCUS323006, partial [marine metagenome]
VAEFPDIISCVSCDKALFLSEEEQVTGVFTCPHCKNENSAAETRAVAAKQMEAEEANVATPASEQKFPELIECPECEKALKLMPEQRDDDSATCLYCKATIAAPEPPAEETPEEEVVEEETPEEEVAEEEVAESVETEQSHAAGEEAEAVSEEIAEADIAAKSDVYVGDVELPDVFGCLSCDRALFLNETERASGDFTCPHCKHENSAAETRAVAAKQLEAKGGNVATPAPEQKFEELIECPDCEKAIKLMLEQ